MYEKTDKTTVVYYTKLQYTLQQTTIYTLQYQCKYFNISGTIIGLNPSWWSDTAPKTLRFVKREGDARRPGKTTSMIEQDGNLC